MDSLAIVCICMQVTEDEIVDALKSGATTLPEIREKTGANTGCRRCEDSVKRVIERNLQKKK